jgi:hypothetical protein
MPSLKNDPASFRHFEDVGPYAARLVTADFLKAQFDDFGTIRRKSFCEALDIAESTLSTWLQTGRIPRVVAVAYTLWLAHQNLRAKIDRYKEPQVVRWRDAYAVVRPPDLDQPDAVGQVIAGRIEDAEHARKIACDHSQWFREVLDEAIEMLRVSEQDSVVMNLERLLESKCGPITIDELF